MAAVAAGISIRGRRCSRSISAPATSNGSMSMPAADLAAVACPAAFSPPRATCCSRAIPANLVAFDPANGKILWHQRLTSSRQQRSVHVDAGWQAVYHRGRGRHALRLHAGGKVAALNMTRRQVLTAAGAIPALLSRASAASTNPLGKRGLGGGPAGFGQRVRANRHGATAGRFCGLLP